ncbi:hypothetical protein CRP01_41775, partial [Flavilitoribacter nigricans DSM 23189 = NBRC 102662]
MGIASRAVQSKTLWNSIHNNRWQRIQYLDGLGDAGGIATGITKGPGANFSEAIRATTKSKLTDGRRDDDPVTVIDRCQTGWLGVVGGAFQGEALRDGVHDHGRQRIQYLDGLEDAGSIPAGIAKSPGANFSEVIRATTKCKQTDGRRDDDPLTVIDRCQTGWSGVVGGAFQGEALRDGV